MIKTLLTLLAAALILTTCTEKPDAAPPSLAVTGELTSGDAAPSTIYGRSTGEIRTPIRVLLILSQAPRLNESAEVTLVMTSTLDAPGATAEILLPPGAVASAGALTWAGDLLAEQRQQLQATIKFTQEGAWTLTGKALRPAGGREVWGDMAVIYLQVTADRGEAGFPQEPNVPHDGGQAPAPDAP